MVIFLSILVWITNILSFDLFLGVVSLPQNLTISVTLTVLVALAVAAPSAPGFIGVFQVATVAAFSLFGISKETAVTYSLLSHIHQYLLIVLLGVAVLIRTGTSLSELKKKTAS